MSSQTLPLSAFEHLMVAQDSPAYPCVVYCKMQFRGRIDREAFTRSLAEMLDRHPLLRSRVQRFSSGIRWIHETSDRVPVVWESQPLSEDWVSDSRLDLYREVGMKVFVHELPDTCTLVFQGHHACVDGVGFQAALHDLWLLYDSRVRGAQWQLPEFDPSLLPARNRFGMTVWKAIAAIPKQAVGLLGVRQYLMREPVPVLPHDPISNTDPLPLPASCHVVRFNAATVPKLRLAAAKHQVTLNEMLASAVFEAIASFRHRRGHQTRDEWIRMMIPVNMRTTEEDARQTACNIVSSVFLDRTPAHIEDRPGLLAGIHEEMELIKRNRLSLIFIASLWVKKHLPAPSATKSIARRCETTVVVTNVGRVFSKSPLRSQDGYLQTGNLVLDDIIMLAPVTPLLSAAFTISEYAGELILALRYDKRTLPSEDALDLLELVVEGSNRWIESPADSTEV